MARDETTDAEPVTTTEGRRPDVIEAAVRFVAAQTGGPERLLTIHRSRPDGYCAGCSASHARWPCAVATIATAASIRTARRTR